MTKPSKNGERAGRRALAITASLVALWASACTPIVTQNAPAALQTAESRARFELDCPDVQATVISQKEIQLWAFAGSEHTIGVRGCGKQAVYLTYCRDPEDCNAVAQTSRLQEVPGGFQPGMQPGIPPGMP
jgi:anti-sigma-K factor RskA